MSRPDPLAWTIGDCADGPMSAGSPGMGGNGESADAGGDEQTQAGRQHDDSISSAGGIRPNLEGFPETSRAEEQHLTTPVDRKTGGAARDDASATSSRPFSLLESLSFALA